jgi:hypothetical protein
MPKGPHELRLDSYVSDGNVDNIRYSAKVWDHGHTALERLAQALESAKPHLLTRFGPQTGPAAVAAFETVAKNVRAQAAEMQKASSALTTAGNALEDAQSTHHGLGNAPASPPSDPTQKSGETPEAFHTRQRQANSAQSQYAGEYAERERKAQAATTTVDTHYQQAITVMEGIHGQPPSHTQGTGTGSGSSVPGGSIPGGSHSGIPSGGSTITGPSTGGVTGPGGPTTPPGPGGPGYPGGPGGPGQPGSPGGPGWPPVGHPGSPQGPGFPGETPPPANPGSGVPTDPPPGGVQVPGGTTAPSTMLGGALSGGMIGGASSLSGALRASAMSTALSEEEMLAASRANGATAVSARGAATGATSTGRGGGAGAGGRGDRGRKKRRASGVDFFEDNDDWLDEDEASSGVLH